MKKAPQTSNTKRRRIDVTNRQTTQKEDMESFIKKGQVIATIDRPLVLRDVESFVKKDQVGEGTYG